MPVRGRFAPSPTGGLHLGSALAALVSWLSIRSKNGTYLWRVEDLDGPRVVAGSAIQQMEEARWLGLDWDEGPDRGGPHTPYEQSKRGSVYEDALLSLATSGHLFPCNVSRKDLRELASAPHEGNGLPPYPKTLRPSQLDPDWYDQYRAKEVAAAALRFRVSDEPVAFHDRVMGHVVENVAESVGDFVLKRRDGVYAYQLAVVVDDLDMGVTEVVRGGDLLDSTARQIQLIRALGGSIPACAHLPLIVNNSNEKLAKRDHAVPISEFRRAGISPQTIVGWLASAVGLLDSYKPILPAGLADQFDWNLIRPQSILAPEHPMELFAQLEA